MRKKILFGTIGLVIIAALVVVLIIVNPKRQEEKNISGTVIDDINTDDTSVYESADIKESDIGSDSAIESGESDQEPVVIENEGDIEIIIPEEMGQDGV